MGTDNHNHDEMNDTLHLKILVGLVDAILGTLNLLLTKNNVNLQTFVLIVKKSFWWSPYQIPDYKIVQELSPSYKNKKTINHLYMPT